MRLAMRQLPARGQGKNMLRTSASRGASDGSWRSITSRMPLLLDPVDARRRIDLRRIVVGQEAVALEPPSGHQDEDAEGGIGDGEAGRAWSRRRTPVRRSTRSTLP